MFKVKAIISGWKRESSTVMYDFSHFFRSGKLFGMTGTDLHYLTEKCTS